MTTFDDCFSIEMDQETFSAHEPAERSTMVRAMGRSMLRKDDPEHKPERMTLSRAIRPVAIKSTWHEVFERNADLHLERLRQLGPGADLFREYAVPFAADNLTAVLGLKGVSADTMMDWSHTLIAGIGNVVDDSDIWAQTARVNAEIEASIVESAAVLREKPDDSILSSFLHAPHEIPDEVVRANVKLAISGGVNEPSHVISSAVWELLTHPEQLAAVAQSEREWSDVFEETARHQSPVGMYPRFVTRDTEVGGVPIPKGSSIGVVVASANRDERIFQRPEEFDLFRERVTNLSFGNGTHICAGNWLARDMVGAVALPRLFAEFPTLRLADPDAVEFRGWVFRGTTALPVEW